jgi:hypothetical protein
MITRQEELDDRARVHELIRPGDLGEASAINDSASRVGGVIAIAIMPALIGASGGRSLAHALAHGYPPVIIAMAASASPPHSSPGCSSPITVSLARTPAPHPRTHGYALPVLDSAATS